MRKTALAAIALAIAATAPALAKTDCEAGYKAHMAKMSIYVDKVTGYDLADAVRRSLDAYNACKAGDDFSPHGVWDKIEAEMKTKAGG